MPKITTKKLVVAGVATAVVVGGAGAAFAYWTTSGSGTGSATTSSGNGAAIAISDNSSGLNAMYPGDAPQTVTVTATNSDTSQSAYVNGVTALLSVKPAGTGSCDASDYLLNGVAGTTSPVAVKWTPQELGATKSATTTYTLQFNNKTSAQDGCKGAAVSISYASN